MTQHIIDTDELEKLIKCKIDLYDSQMEGADYDDFIRNEWAAGAMRQLLKDLRALIANSPQADDVRKDAERYRWLRHGDNDELVIRQGNVDKNYHWLPRLEHLDSEIDKHMASEAIDKARE